MPLEIVTVPCLRENFAYLLREPDSGKVGLVDAPEAGAIEAALGARGWGLDVILITHHHADHIDGVARLRKIFGAEVAGAAADRHRLPPLDIALEVGGPVTVGAETGEVIDVPGHTVGHVAFHFPRSNALFSADSLMALGCGRLFEGTPAQMWQSLCRLADLPPETRMYSGHDCTEANARFACSVDPDNEARDRRLDEIEALKRRGERCVSTELRIECATNPFLRAGASDMKSQLGMTDAPDVEVFAELRRRKDAF